MDGLAASWHAPYQGLSLQLGHMPRPGIEPMNSGSWVDAEPRRHTSWAVDTALLPPFQLLCLLLYLNRNNVSKHLALLSNLNLSLLR